MHIVLADDQFDVRLALRCLLQQEFDFDRIGEVKNAAKLLTYIAVDCPDLLLLDWELPGIPMPALLRAIRVLCPQLKIVALSVRPEACDEALRLGVDAFASKGDPAEKLLLTLRRLSLI